MGEILIYGIAIIAIGSLFVLERRCLGQMAIVQPLVTCLVAGWISGNETTGLWLGISLQLFSLTPLRQVNWALSGVVAAATLLMAHKLGIPIAVGGKAACSIIIVVMIVGIAARALERRYARKDGERMQRHSPWLENDPVRAVESLVHRTIARWFIVGGIEVLVGTGLALIIAYGVGSIGDLDQSGNTAGALVVPALGAAVAASSLVEYRFLALTGLSAVVSIVVFV